MKDRMESIRRFLAEADRLKNVQRRSVLIDGSRVENSAEHTWHACLFALVLHGELDGRFDLLETLKMLIVHDIVEIDAGDTYAYDDHAHQDKTEREQKAAERLFSLLPDDLAAGLRTLWESFEAQETPEARFARACDKLEALNLNVSSGGLGWKRGRVRKQQVLAYNADVHESDPALKRFFEYLMNTATEKEMFGAGDES